MAIEVTCRTTAHLDEGLSGLIDDSVRLYAQQAYHRLMKPYIPRRTGTLMENVIITKDGVRFVSPYACYLYHGKVMVDPDTKKAGWFDPKKGRWRSRWHVKKVQSDRDLQFNRELNPYACAYWDKAAMVRRGESFVREITGYIIRKANQNGR